MKKTVIILIVVFSLLSILSSTYITSAFLVSSPSNKIRGEISSGGHMNLTWGSPQNFSRIVVGQPVIGFTSGGNFKMCLGFLCAEALPSVLTRYSMNFSGRLNYSDGSPVINSLIKVTIKDPISKYEKSANSETGGLGEFFVKITNLPEVIMDKDLDISIYVQSEVEALYTCFYNHSSTNCCKRPFTVC